jgi:hypothetical protein
MVRAALLLVPVVLLLAACGGDAASVDPVAKAANTTAKDGSAHVAFTASSTSAGAKVDISGSGDFSTASEEGQLSIQFRSAQSSGTIRELLKDGAVYMISPLFQATVPQGKAWVKIDLKKAGHTAGFDVNSFSAATPDQTLALLKKTGKVVKIGLEKLDGVATTHYRASIDPAKLKQDNLPAGATVTYEPIDVWIDSTDHVRRLHVAYSAGAAGSSEMAMSFSRFGQPVNVTLPDESVVWDATSLAAATMKLNGGNG